MLDQNLKRWRKAIRLTQSEIAAQLGINRTTYANYELGIANPPPATMERLAQLGFDPQADEPEVLRPRATIRQVRLLIDIIYDCKVAHPIRETSYQELLRALGMT